MAGLILLVIVGAWLAVLVPMALRSHDSAASLKSADRFGDAMRVLSRRSTRDVLVPRRAHESLVVSETRSPRVPVVVPPVEPLLAPVETPRTPAQRRLRTLVVLVAVSWMSLFLALMGLSVFLAVHVGADLALVAFAVHCRRQAIRRAERRAAELRQARRARVAARPAPRVAGIPVTMPPRPEPLATPLPAPAARYEDKPLAATGTTGVGQPWSPVPVPPPMYVGKATAPRRAPRVLDLTKPGEWTAALEGDDLDLVNDGPELDDILDRRRTVNGW